MFSSEDADSLDSEDLDWEDMDSEDIDSEDWDSLDSELKFDLLILFILFSLRFYFSYADSEDFDSEDSEDSEDFGFLDLNPLRRRLLLLPRLPFSTLAKTLCINSGLVRIALCIEAGILLKSLK